MKRIDRLIDHTAAVDQPSAVVDAGFDKRAADLKKMGKYNKHDQNKAEIIKGRVAHFTGPRFVENRTFDLLKQGIHENNLSFYDEPKSSIRLLRYAISKHSHLRRMYCIMKTEKSQENGGLFTGSGKPFLNG